jgi:hypothetical protein
VELYLYFWHRVEFFGIFHLAMSGVLETPYCASAHIKVSAVGSIQCRASRFLFDDKAVYSRPLTCNFHQCNSEWDVSAYGTRLGGSYQAKVSETVVNPVVREILCDIRLDWLRTVDERPAQNAVES